MAAREMLVLENTSHGEQEEKHWSLIKGTSNYLPVMHGGGHGQGHSHNNVGPVSLVSNHGEEQQP
jgi:hypothetical protein